MDAELGLGTKRGRERGVDIGVEADQVVLRSLGAGEKTSERSRERRSREEH